MDSTHVVLGPHVHEQCLPIVHSLQQIIEIRKLDYDWEPWMHAELGLALKNLYAISNWAVERGKPGVYKNALQVVDIWIPGQDKRPNVGIEVKITTKAVGLVQAMRSDYIDKAKVSASSGVNEAFCGYPKTMGTMLWGIGITPLKAEANNVITMLGQSALEAKKLGTITWGVLPIDGTHAPSMYIAWWFQRY